MRFNSFLLFIILLLGGLLKSPILFGQNPNLLINPSFEDISAYQPGIAVGSWVLWKSRGDSKIFLSDKEPYDGKKCLQLVLGSGSRGALLQEFDIIGGVKVDLQFVYRFRDCPAGGDKFIWGLLCYDEKNRIFYVQSDSLLEGMETKKAGWINHSRTVYIPRNTVHVKFQFFYSRAQGTLELDAVSVTQNPEVITEKDESVYIHQMPADYDFNLVKKLPLGFYTPYQEIEKMKDTGAGFYVDYYNYGKKGEADFDLLISRLDEDQAAGYKRIIFPYFCDLSTADYAQKTEGIKSLVPRIQDHPALFGYYLADEGNEGGFSIGELKRYHQLIKSIDPRHPTLEVENNLAGFCSYHQVCDISLVDSYPSLVHPGFTPVGDRGSLERVLTYNNIYNELTGKKKPFWIVPQGFSYAYMQESQMYAAKSPSMDDFRANTYLALASGASGVLTYGFIYAYIEPGTRIGIQQTYRELSKIGNYFPYGIRRELPLKTGRSSSVFINGWKSAAGDIIIGVNYGTAEEKAAFTVNDKNFSQVLHVFPEQRTLSGKESSSGIQYSDSFKPGTAHVYVTAPIIGEEKILLELARKKYTAELTGAEEANKNNVAWRWNGCRMKASSSRRWLPILAHDGITNLVSEDGIACENFWQDNTLNQFPDWLEAEFSATETVQSAKIVTFNLRDFEIQAEQSGEWKTIASVKHNTSHNISVKFSPVTAAKMRLYITAINSGQNMFFALDGYCEVVEFSVYRK